MAQLNRAFAFGILLWGNDAALWASQGMREKLVGYCDGAGVFQQIMHSETGCKPRAVPADHGMG